MKVVEVFDGIRLENGPGQLQVPSPIMAFYGDNGQYIPINEELLSRHMMILGGIGTGKTNTFYQIIGQLNKAKKQDDLFIIFDTKGEYLQDFYEAGDIVISNDENARGENGSDYWNIFKEIDDNAPEESINEIANIIFREKIEKTSQVFFPMAAKDLFAAILTHFYRVRDKIQVDNKILRDFIDVCDGELLRELLSSHQDLYGMASYIFDDRSPQTQGVLSELQQTLRQIFIGNFKKSGNLAMSDLLMKKAGKKIFIEYDLAQGRTLSPIYTLLFDLAIKKSLSRSRNTGNVYFITDEFSLVPNLSHVDDAVNFGRSLGIKFVIGIQNVEQIFDIYGESRARSLLSGFLTSIVFNLNEPTSKQYVQGLHGKNRKKEIFQSSISSRGISEQIRDAYVVEDWDIASLKTGEAIISMPGTGPFKFKFARMR